LASCCSLLTVILSVKGFGAKDPSLFRPRARHQKSREILRARTMGPQDDGAAGVQVSTNARWRRQPIAVAGPTSCSARLLAFPPWIKILYTNCTCAILRTPVQI
jgi:hypothetical protein